MITQYDIIMITDGHPWAGCLATVIARPETSDDGMTVAFIRSPAGNYTITQEVRLDEGQYVVVGKATHAATPIWGESPGIMD